MAGQSLLPNSSKYPFPELSNSWSSLHLNFTKNLINSKNILPLLKILGDSLKSMDDKWFLISNANLLLGLAEFVNQTTRHYKFIDYFLVLLQLLLVLTKILRKTNPPQQESRLYFLSLMVITVSLKQFSIQKINRVVITYNNKISTQYPKQPWYCTLRVHPTCPRAIVIDHLTRRLRTAIYSLHTQKTSVFTPSGVSYRTTHGHILGPLVRLPA